MRTLGAALGLTVMLLGGASRAFGQAPGGAKPGEEIQITFASGPRIKRIFVALRTTEIVVLNLNAARLPSSAKNALRNAARQIPQDLANGLPRQALVDGQVRIQSDGVFQKGRKLTELDDVIERLPRSRMRFIRGEEARPRDRSSSSCVCSAGVLPKASRIWVSALALS
jgi:hypothetical protein